MTVYEATYLKRISYLIEQLLRVRAEGRWQSHHDGVYEGMLDLFAMLLEKGEICQAMEEEWNYLAKEVP